MVNTMVVRSHPDGALLTVWVVPGARKTEIVGIHGDALRIRVTAAPERGQANKAVLALLQQQFGGRFRLAGGAGSRRKRIVAVGVAAEELWQRISKLPN
ncbi:MAG: DUF167 family protein [Acidimicrobiia bacterium]|nr:DUF167 family protein [Acidimicrobiia bacterium]